MTTIGTHPTTTNVAAAANRLITHAPPINCTHCATCTCTNQITGPRADDTWHMRSHRHNHDLYRTTVAPNITLPYPTRTRPYHHYYYLSNHLYHPTSTQPPLDPPTTNHQLLLTNDLTTLSFTHADVNLPHPTLLFNHAHPRGHHLTPPTSTSPTAHGS